MTIPKRARVIAGGIAFGMGVERMALLKYNIPNLRYLYENDLRFLTQYR